MKTKIRGTALSCATAFLPSPSDGDHFILFIDFSFLLPFSSGIDVSNCSAVDHDELRVFYFW